MGINRGLRINTQDTEEVFQAIENVAQNLCAMVAQIEALRRILINEPTRANSLLEDISYLGRESLTEIRSIVGS
ncbi:histidine kinase [Luteococcus sp.]|uniref:histidine kinase n=1 Tax=Luteococcus sp. TaxID=1969402 RepID=UPI00373686D9